MPVSVYMPWWVIKFKLYLLVLRGGILFAAKFEHTLKSLEVLIRKSSRDLNSQWLKNI